MFGQMVIFMHVRRWLVNFGDVVVVVNLFVVPLCRELTIAESRLFFCASKCYVSSPILHWLRLMCTLWLCFVTHDSLFYVPLIAFWGLGVFGRCVCMH